MKNRSIREYGAPDRERARSRPSSSVISSKSRGSVQPHLMVWQCCAEGRPRCQLTDAAVLVGEDAADRQAAPPSAAQTAQVAPSADPAWRERSRMLGARPESGLSGSQASLMSVKRAACAS